MMVLLLALFALKFLSQSVTAMFYHDSAAGE